MSTHTILVVDDEPASVRTIERTLGEEHRIVGASSAAAALTVLAAEPVALMIADQRMPEMTGTELLARSMLVHPDVIRVLLTGYTGLDTLVEAINAGHVYYYLTKPWEPRELRLVVRRGLEHHDAQTHRARLIRELKDACARVQREADQKSRLLTLAAHELGTPLHVMTNALALLAEADLAPRPRTWLDTASRSAEWMARALGQMATAARWRTRAVTLRPRSLDLGALLRGLERTFAPIATARALTLHLDLAGQLPHLSADPVWLERALANLLSNAVRFTPDGGAITVSAAAHAATVEITVADTGTGIDDALLDEVFEPFSAAGGDPCLHTSGRFEFGSRGLGLGLAMAKAIIGRHGGSVAVRSRTGAGSQFTVTLPLSASGVEPAELL